MTLRNTYDGLKTLKAAEVLNTVGLSIAGLIVLISMISSGSIGSRDSISSQELAQAMGGGAMFITLGFGTVILALIAYIMQIVGVNKAKTEDASFDNALMYIIGGIIVSVIDSFAGGWFAALLSIATKVLSLLVVLCIINGVRNIAVKLENAEMDKKGGMIYIVMIVLSVLAIAFGMLDSMIPSMELLLTFVAGCFNIAKSVVFLTYLSKAVKMFGIEEEIKPL